MTQRAPTGMVGDMNENRATATEILLLRHAEKPGECCEDVGLGPDGRPDPESLTIRGWQRAGGLAALLAPGPFTALLAPGPLAALLAPGPLAAPASPVPRLLRPDRIHASAFRKGGGHSRRPEQTVLPLAAKLEQVVDLRWALHGEEAFGAALSAQVGVVVLVCWQHQGLPALARAVAAPQRLPELPDGWEWPKNRFDVIWSLRRERPGDIWRFSQHCQLLLAGDQAQPFDLPGAA